MLGTIKSETNRKLLAEIERNKNDEKRIKEDKEEDIENEFHQADWAVSQESTRTPEPVILLVLDYGASKGTEDSTSFLSRGRTRRYTRCNLIRRYRGVA